jgi:diadenosine tetraphosphate (Ap4A) HIT family hydrolase
MESCSFCNAPNSDIIFKLSSLFVIENKRNSRKGNHFLIIPFRHIHSINDFTGNELRDLASILDVIKLLGQEKGAQGYYLLADSVLINANPNSFHFRIHIIFKFENDDPLFSF